MTHAALDAVIVFSQQMGRRAEFYQHGLGIGPFEASEGHMGCRLETVYFGIDQFERPRQAQGGGVSTWFRVDYLQAAYDRLIDLGAISRYAPTEKPWGDVLASVFDLDGNVVGLSQRTADAEPA